jgi:hypothetical protein
MFNQQHNLGEIFKQFQQKPNNDVDIDIDDIDDMDDDDENDDIEVDIPDDNNNAVNFQKIIVSDTEYEQPIKIINIDFNSENNLDELNEVDEVDEVDEADDESIDEPNNEDVITLDYKKMDTNNLRTMVISRGLATDTKKLKKNDLIKLLEQ